MKILLTILLIATGTNSTSFDLIKTGLPFKVKKYKVSMKLVDNRTIKGYLMDVNLEYLYYVKEKNDINEAIVNECESCRKVKIADVKKVKVKRESSGILFLIITLVAALLLTLTFQGTSISEPYIHSVNLLFLLGVSWLTYLIPYYLFWSSPIPMKLVKLKQKSTLWHVEQIREESIYQFMQSENSQRKYKIFVEDYSTYFAGFYLDHDTNRLRLTREPDGVGEIIEIDRQIIRFVQKD